MRSFIHVADAAAEREAEELDRRIASGEKDAVGPLAGVLVGVKDNLCTANMPSTGGSRILDGYRPAYDATAVRRLREAGAIVVGKTNLDEFGMGSTTEGSAFQVWPIGDRILIPFLRGAFTFEALPLRMARAQILKLSVKYDFFTLVVTNNDTKIFVTLPNSVHVCGWFKDNVRAILMQGSSKRSSWFVACHC